MSDRANLTETIAPVTAQPLSFRTSGIGRPSDVTLVPFYKASDFRYTVYWNTYSTAEWTKREAEVKAADARRRDLESRGIDTVDISSPESESAHAYRGESATQPYLDGRAGRESRDGWFEYQLKVAPDRPTTLVCTYRGSEGRRRTFDILVDGQKIATDTVPYHPTELLDVEYPLPESLTKGKDRVTVRFVPQEKAATAAVFEIRTVAGK